MVYFNSSFNATLVRLNGLILPVSHLSFKLCFNATLVRLNDYYRIEAGGPVSLRFNATLVRLNARTMLHYLLSHCKVSMPPWCD